MLKTIVTLVRGAAFRAEEEFADRSALLILDQQIRDAAAGIERAKRALAVAIAQDEAEGKRLETTLARIADLEERAVAALNGGSEELAAEAAEAIAVMEADRDSIREARATFAREIGALKATVRKSASGWPSSNAAGASRSAAESVRRLKAGSRPRRPERRDRARRRGGDAAPPARAAGRGCGRRERLRGARRRAEPGRRSRKASKPPASASAPARPPPSVLERLKQKTGAPAPAA